MITSLQAAKVKEFVMPSFTIGTIPCTHVSWYARDLRHSTQLVQGLYAIDYNVPRMKVAVRQEAEGPDTPPWLVFISKINSNLMQNWQPGDPVLAYFTLA